MAEYTDKAPNRKSKAAGHTSAQPQHSSNVHSFGFVDSRKVGIVQRKLQEVADSNFQNTQASRVYQLIGADQQSVRDDGNKVPTAYQIAPGNLDATKGHLKSWDSEMPTLDQFETATSKFWALRKSDIVLTQIDTLLNKFNQLGGAPDHIQMKKELAQEIILACEFWLKKVNKPFAGKKPIAAAAHATNLSVGALKLRGEEERRPGIVGLSIACASWLDKNGFESDLGEILNSRSLQNQGVTDAHGNKDVNTWDQRAGTGKIFPEPAHRADWNNSRPMNEDQDYVVLQNDDQKRTAKLVFRGGVAYRWQNILNPNSAFDVHTSKGEEHFAMDKSGHIYTGTLGMLFFHSSLLGFADAIAAGMMRVNGGKVVYLSNDSGHYKPDVGAMVRVLHQLQRYGVNVNAIVVDRKHTPGLADSRFQGSEILAGDYSKWPDQP